MIRRPPRSTRTDTLFPYTTLFRSYAGRTIGAARPIGDRLAAAESDPPQRVVEFVRIVAAKLGEHLPLGLASHIGAGRGAGHEEARSEERRVGKECDSTCRYGWSQNH